jgi:hypothetical protein
MLVEHNILSEHLRGSMLFSIITSNVWVALGLWICIYITDYALTLRGARLYRQGAQAYMRFDGSYELNPIFERDVDAQRRLSRRFVIMLGSTCLLIWFAWRGTQIHLFPPIAFAFWMGVLVLMEVPVLIRHGRNLATFQACLGTSDIRGQISYPRWLVLQLSSVEFGLFAGLFLALSSVANPGFFLGGTVGCLSVAIQHMRLAKRAKKLIQTSAEAPASSLDHAP